MNGIFLYNLFLSFIAAVGFPVLFPLVVLSEKRRNTVWRRLGFKNHRGFCPRLDSGIKPIWIHALSVGEVLSIEPFLAALKQRVPTRPLILSVSTQTGYQIARRELVHLTDYICYSPLDFVFCVKRAIRKINPALVLIVETDIWPNFIHELKEKGIPVCLLNARLSDTSMEGYRRFSAFFKPLFSVFSRICVQSPPDAERFKRLGIEPTRLYLTGNMKFDRKHPLPTPDECTDLQKKLNIGLHQPVIVAGSTHNGEEALLFAGMKPLKKKWSSLLMIVAPRDPKRASLVCQNAIDIGFRALPFSSLDGKQPGEAMDIIVVDAMGMLRDLYAICDIAFVGGSLIPLRGHNPLEPAACGKPVLFGPDMRDFQTISTALESKGGAETISDAEAFFHACDKLLSAPDKAKEMGEIALHVFQRNGGAVVKTLAAVESLIPPHPFIHKPQPGDAGAAPISKD